MKRVSLTLRGGLVLAGVALLVFGGLSYATVAALRLESAQLESLHQAAQAEQLRLALWRLDSRMTPALAREESRPFANFLTISSPTSAFTNIGTPWGASAVWLPSPLLSAELPDWMQLHFQLDSKQGWQSPQVPQGVIERFVSVAQGMDLRNVTPERRHELDRLCTLFPARETLQQCIVRMPAPETSEEATRPLESPTTLAQSNVGPTPDDSRPIGQAVPLEEPQSPAQTVSPPGMTAIPQQSPQPPRPTATSRNARNDDPRQQGQYAGVSQMPSPPGMVPPGQNSAFAQGKQQLAPLIEQGRAAREAANLEFNIRSNASQRGFQEGKQAYGNDLTNYPQIRVSSLKDGLQNSAIPMALRVGSIIPHWLTSANGTHELMLLRRVQVGNSDLIQGVLLDWGRLETLLRAEIVDLFPEATLQARLNDTPTAPDRAMTTLPVDLVPGPPTPLPPVGLTTLRLGLGAAWIAAILALIAVGLGGWSLLELSERRIHFVSAVTHELRTPLTTLRLYLDLLTSGLVRDEAKRDEYLRTLHLEADRLHRLIGNVLDFARLENHRTALECQDCNADSLLMDWERDWGERCRLDGKQLEFHHELRPGWRIHTDGRYLSQIVGNFIDNARKYSREATDPRILVTLTAHDTTLRVDVRDFGPGIASREQRRIFHPFRRGRDADVTAGGVGLGLALAQRWATALGGSLHLVACDSAGACFRLEIPHAIRQAPLASSDA
ncbi:sensor histidine kinase [Tuwongella immobilis]|uniref:histidine kinase n=1 Tax=Tuwongella immobilis TaxID=692036 RepID=A0A6C2YL53_9BACT|nr:HAMP domain-containing sensor histidine kinase [Tuwongella immobilis]VIP01843.1 histidine kinase : Histidine kinase OS=Cystobacter violaceus Cb vi76 GN=Q664_05475 PE=4 SV=1: HisKA: HATPase_c [Tuwongella immobilis]VTR99617.1 histidine kinase : Histidine kinase OS=Cystobacter violaceus Cb vi76 GN=Q664_05475 PE=4 SV=1: HisKA: HATPase_c [Tuwongella immobilis]